MSKNRQISKSYVSIYIDRKGVCCMKKYYMTFMLMIGYFIAGCGTLNLMSKDLGESFGSFQLFYQTYDLILIGTGLIILGLMPFIYLCSSVAWTLMFGKKVA